MKLLRIKLSAVSCIIGLLISFEALATNGNINNWPDFLIPVPAPEPTSFNHWSQGPWSYDALHSQPYGQSGSGSTAGWSDFSSTQPYGSTYTSGLSQTPQTSYSSYNNHHAYPIHHSYNESHPQNYSSIVNNSSAQGHNIMNGLVMGQLLKAQWMEAVRAQVPGNPRAIGLYSDPGRILWEKSRNDQIRKEAREAIKSSIARIDANKEINKWGKGDKPRRYSTVRTNK